MRPWRWLRQWYDKAETTIRPFLCVRGGISSALEITPHVVQAWWFNQFLPIDYLDWRRCSVKIQRRRKGCKADVFLHLCVSIAR
ncbi:MAG TPA: hypothetical protein VNH11_26530 [Pirellulales bacterium]|nr:hypothetical protein [Pirellulales bacterium]